MDTPGSALVRVGVGYSLCQGGGEVRALVRVGGVRITLDKCFGCSSHISTPGRITFVLLFSFKVQILYYE